MEYGTIKEIDYNFLKEEKFEKSFADLNIKLLSGVHIQVDNYDLFTLLEERFDELATFYRNLYKLSLEKGIFDQINYYYLDFFSNSKGKLTDPSRHKELTEMQTLTGLMLIDMYYARYFDNPKTIGWSDIKKQIGEGDHKHSYQRILFRTVRAEYTVNEWQQTEKKFRDAINSFDKLGWVTKKAGSSEELVFDINASIGRLVSLYRDELENFDQFTTQIKTNLEE